MARLMLLTSSTSRSPRNALSTIRHFPISRNSAKCLWKLSYVFTGISAAIKPNFQVHQPKSTLPAAFFWTQKSLALGQAFLLAS